MNKNGKTFTIFTILTLVLLVSSTSIGFFLYHHEKELRKDLEDQVEASHTSEAKLQADLKEARHQLTIAQDKAKEADDKINNLMDEMELNEGLRKELRNENTSLKEVVQSSKKDKAQFSSEVDDAEKKYKVLQELFKAEQDKTHNLQTRIELEHAKDKAESENQTLKSDLKPYDQRIPDAQVAPEVITPPSRDGNKVQLDKIVVNPNEGTRGRVLSVDKDSEFIVCNLGMKQGIKSGDILEVFRGEEYLGDTRVSRVQDELSAADIIPPFTSHKVRKNDTVVFKP